MSEVSSRPNRSNANVPARARILEAATALFWRDGYHQVSVDTICLAAGVQKGSFYHAFSSKADLLCETITRVRDADLGDLQAIHRGDAAPDHRLRSHIEWFGISQRRLKAKYGFVPGTFDMVLDVQAPDEARVIIRDARSRYQAILDKAVIDVLAPVARRVDMASWLSSSVRQLIDGALIGARLSDSLSGFDLLPETIFAFLGIQPAPFGLYLSHGTAWTASAALD